MGLSFLWFVTVQTRWFFSQIEQGWWSAFRLALRYLLLALALIVGIILLLLKN